MLARKEFVVHPLRMATDADRNELELRVSDVAYEVANFSWADVVNSNNQKSPCAYLQTQALTSTQGGSGRHDCFHMR